MRDLTVAIINYNSRQWLKRCLCSLVQHHETPPLSVMVIDNASPDDSVDMVRSQFADAVRLIANRSNLGFARAVNQALSLSQGRYLLILNADIEVHPGAIACLYHYMEAHPRVGLAGGKLLDEQGRIQPSCRRFYTPLAILLRRTLLGRFLPQHPALREHLMLDWDHDQNQLVDWIQGACLFLRRQAIDDIGAMDENFFLYFEDVDLCQRMHRGTWQVAYVPGATFLHHYQRASASRGWSSAKTQHLKSGLYYFVKWYVYPRVQALLE